MPSIERATPLTPSTSTNTHTKDMSDVAGKDAASITMSDFSGYIEKYGKSIAKFQRNHSEERTLAEKHATEEDVQAQIAACYTAVPRIFFASNFDLKDPTIFAAALNAVGNGGNSKDEPHRATSTSTLQPHAHPEEDGGEAAISTLSTHLETTELALLSLISSRSDSFFSQLHNLQLFREQITSTCHAIVDTRQSLDNIHQRFVAGNIRVPRLKRRKANAESLQRIVHMILKVQKTQQVVQSNLEHGHFGEALDAIHQAQVALQGPLAAISSLKPLRVQLDSFVKLIANTMASRFLDLAASMNVLFLDETESEQLSRRVSFKEKLLPLVKGLVRVGQLRQVMSKYRGRLTEVVTLVVRTAVSASLETSGAEDGTSTSRDGDSDGDTSRGARGGQGGKSTSVVKKLRSLNDKEFQSMLKDVLEHLMSVVTQASSVHSMLLVALEDTRDDVSENTEASNSGSPMSRRSASIGASSARQKKLQREGCERDSREALEHMWRVAQRHIGKMFEVREHELSVQPLEKQKALWDMVSEFVTQAQKKCGRRGDTLLNTLMSQVKKYLEQAQLRLKARVEHALTRDGWGEAQILPAHTKSLRAISNFAEGKPRDDAPTNSGVDVADPSAATVPEKSLRFGDETFHVPTCVLELLSVFDIHLQCVQDFPAHVITIMHQILDLVGMFNQRTTELILGTGALALYVQRRCAWLWHVVEVITYHTCLAGKRRR